MHIDARNLENNTLIEGDICIVGAGAAGITLAMQFIGSPLKIILLEGGGFEYEPAMQDLYRGKSVGLPYYSLESSRLHYFGGTTGHWAGYCSQYDDIDFKKREWVPGSGWPVTRKDLDPFYNPALKFWSGTAALVHQGVEPNQHPECSVRNATLTSKSLHHYCDFK